MKKLILILLCGVGTFFAGCKKESVVPQPPVVTPPVPPIEVTHSVVVTNLTPNLGVVTPTTAIVKDGGSLPINFLPDSGKRLSLVKVNGKAMTVTNNTLTLTNIKDTIGMVVAFTDSLTSQQMDVLKTAAISGKFYDNAYASRPTGTTGPWKPETVLNSAKSYYDLFYADGTYDEYVGTLRHGKWSIGYNGKTFTTIDDQSGNKVTTNIIELTKDKFSYIIINQNGLGVDYQDFATHVQLP